MNEKTEIMAIKLSTVIGGLAGACALTLINQVVSRIDREAPRLDLLGMNAVAKFFKGPKSTPLVVQKLLPLSLAGDLVSNTLYYGLAAGRSKDQTLLKGLALGLGAGIGAVSLPKPMGLDATPTNLSRKTQALTIAWYIIGGLVAAAVINAIDEKDEIIPVASKGKRSTRQLSSVL
jgi:hypothetical protein